MILWIKTDWRQHPELKRLSKLSLEEGAQIVGLAERIAARTLEKGVLVTRGSAVRFESGTK